MLKLITGPSAEPVTLEEARLHLRMDHTDDDGYITGLITAARQHVETICRRALMTQTWDLYLDAFPEDANLEMPLAPLQSVTSITYTGNDGTAYTLSSSLYSVDAVSTPGRIYCDAWPGTSLTDVNGVVVRFVCGYGSLGTDVPMAIRQAMLLIVGHLYERREASSSGVHLLPMGVEALLATYRVAGW